MLCMMVAQRFAPPARGWRRHCWGQAGAGTPCVKILGMCPELNTPLLLTQSLPEIS